MNDIKLTLLGPQRQNSNANFIHYSGITGIVRNVSNPIPSILFKLLLDDQISENLEFQTNLYATQKHQRLEKDLSQRIARKSKLF